MKSKQIAMLLRKALLEEGEMAQSLYEYELEEHIDYWYEGLKADVQARLQPFRQSTAKQHHACCISLHDCESTFPADLAKINVNNKPTAKSGRSE